MIWLISIVGSGRVGASIAFLCASNSLDDILLVNRTKSKAIGESLDIANAIPSNSKFSINGTDDFSKLSNSKIIVITASIGIYTKSRTEHMPLQVKMIKEISSKIKRYCPSAIVLMISNPLDVLTYFFQRETKFSRFKVIGIASSLDSSRFRFLISKKLSVSQHCISNAIVLGEHGDSMVPVFSNTTVNNVPLLSLLKNNRNPITYNLRNYWKKLRISKNRSQFGIAKNTYDVIASIVGRKNLSISGSVLLEGEYGEKNIAMGVPLTISSDGVSEIKEIHLDNYEKKLFKKSAQSIRKNIESLY